MVALGKFGLFGGFESDLLGLFVRYVSALDCRTNDRSCGINTYLDYNFTLLVEIVGRLRQRTLQVTSCQRPVVAARRTVADGIAFLSGTLSVTGTVGAVAVAEERTHRIGFGDSLGLFGSFGCLGRFAGLAFFLQAGLFFALLLKTLGFGLLARFFLLFALLAQGEGLLVFLGQQVVIGGSRGLFRRGCFGRQGHGFRLLRHIATGIFDFAKSDLNALILNGLRYAQIDEPQEQEKQQEEQERSDGSYCMSFGFFGHFFVATTKRM